MPDIVNVVVDLSHHLGNVNLQKAKTDGDIAGVIHKATQGLTFVDPTFKTNRTKARDAGRLAALRRIGSRAIANQIMRRSRTALVLGATVVAVALVVYTVARRSRAGVVDNDGARSETAALLAASTDRPFEGRIAGDPVGASRRPDGPERSARAPSASSPELRIAAARIEQALAIRPTPALRAAFGVGELLLGHTRAAVDVLTEAVSETPGDARVRNDLAVACLALAQSRATERMEYAARSLNASLGAIALDPTLAEAWFNRALALEILPPRDTARQSWNEYVTHEPDPHWHAVGIEHANAAASSVADSWDARRLQLYADMSPSNVLDTVQAFPQQVREHLDEVLLPRWADAHLHHWPEAPRLLSEASTVAIALQRVTADPMAAASVSAIVSAQRRRDMGALAKLASGHRAYGLGRVLRDADHFMEADREFASAARDLREAASPFFAWAVAQGVGTAFARRDFDTATARLDSIDAIVTTAMYPAVSARARWLRGMILTNRSGPAEALDAYRAAARQFDRLGERENAAGVYSVMADCLRTLGDRRGSWESISKTLEYLPSVRRPVSRYLFFFNASLFALQDNWIETALHFQGRALEEARTSGVTTRLVEALARRAYLYFRRSQPLLARHDLDEARRLLPNVPNAPIREYLTAETASVSGEVAAAADPSAALADLTTALDYFKAKEPPLVPRLYLLRGRVHRAQNDISASVRDFAAGVEHFEHQRARLPIDELKISYFDEAWALFADLIDVELSRRQDVHAAFDYLERARARALLDRVLQSPDAAPLTIESVQARLPPHTTLASFVSTDHNVVVWVLTRDRYRVAECAVDRRALDRLTRAYRDALERQSSEAEIADVASHLYDALLAPWYDQVATNDTLVFVLDRPLHTVPMTALRNRRTGRYVVEDHPVVVAPSATMFVHPRPHPLAAAARAVSPDALVIGNPAAAPDHGDLPMLPQAEREAQQVASEYTTARVLLRGDATKAAFIEWAPNARVVHFAGHALLNVEYPLLSRLVLASSDPATGAGDLFAYEIEQLHFPRTRLVVLSACETAVGAERRGEGAMSLARPFLAAGVPFVIGTYWPVEDRTAAVVLTAFHRALRATNDPVAALRLAQLETLNRHDSGLRSPAHWAGFAIFGVSESITEETVAEGTKGAVR